MGAFYVFSSLNTNQRYVCIFFFMSFSHFSIFTFSVSSKITFILTILCGKTITHKRSATVNPYACQYVSVLYCMYILLINQQFSVCLVSRFVYFILFLRVIMYLYDFPWSHNIYTYIILPTKCIVLQTTDGQKRPQYEHSITLTNTYRDKQTDTDMFIFIHSVLHKVL